ncbi:helix-turn-helix domain-containing protein [Arthrobacter sp. PM3]|uniref:helix-turn-helix domain-containing protein n=1 Tax=Arthrobacter sp. PM3 TaxID=2017685 RepID=UPI001ABFB258|nr:helix-turn-helix domain-containing protein [Arthrobacter sp. PM3]
MSEDQREAAVAWFEKGIADAATARVMGVARSPVKGLYLRWRIHGRGVLVAKQTKQVYSFELKLALVERFIAGETAQALAAEAGLSSSGLLKNWAAAYRREGADALRPKAGGRPGRPGSPPPEPEPGPGAELERLRRENERLRAEVAYLGKLRALRAQERR